MRDCKNQQKRPYKNKYVNDREKKKDCIEMQRKLKKNKMRQ